MSIIKTKMKEIYKQCKYNLAWIGQCKNKTNGDFCEEHINLKCPICGKQSLGQCEETFQFVCGQELCEDNCHNHN